MKTKDLIHDIINEAASLKAHAYKLAGNKFDAEDLLQETIIKAIRNQHLYHSEHANLRGWLYIIMRNLQRSTHKRITTHTAIEASQYESKADSNSGESRLLTDELHLQIESLPQEFSEPINYLSYGYSYLEISEKLSIPLGTVKVRIHRARRLLKKTIVTYNAIPDKSVS